MTWGALMGAALTMGCASGQPQALSPAVMAALGPDARARGIGRALVAGLEHLNRGELAAAGAAFNRGLELDPRHPHLNFLNGFVYELRADDGDPSRLELAEIGYRLALRFDPDHWLAAYRLGVLDARRQRVAQARDAFAQALALRSDHAPSAYGLAVASYRLGDPQTAAVALARLPESVHQRPDVRRASALVHAALGDDAAAREALSAYQQVAAPAVARNTARRVDDWRVAHARAEQVAGDPAGDASSGGGAPSPATPRPRPAEPPPQMVLLDVVLLQQELSSASAHGINLLSALKVQLGGTLIDATRSNTVDGRTGAVRDASQSARASMSISVPSVTYALNIANAQNSTSEVVSRPSVLAYHGQESEVFIGSELTYIAGGVNSGRSYNKEVGVSLTARPEFVGDDRIKLEVRTEFTNFIPSTAPGSFQESVATTKSRTRVNAELRIGQTLAIAAGSTTRETETHGGVPILRDIPIVQYFFSTATRSKSQGALLILLTPRRAEEVDAAGEVRHLSTQLARSKDPRAPEAIRALQARYRHWFTPTSTPLKAMHQLLDTGLSGEFRRGDLSFSGLEGVDEPPTGQRPRHRRVVDDLVDLLYL